MGGDSSKISGEGFTPLNEGRTETDFSNTSRHPAISTRSYSVPTRYYGSREEDSTSGSLSKEPLQRHRSTMVVVNRGQDSSPEISNDPLMKKLEELHFFYPLMHDVEKRSGLFGTHNKKALADIQSKIQSLPTLKMVRIYEDRLKRHAQAVSSRQGELTSLVRDTDMKISAMLKSYSDRAKVTAKHVDRLNKLDDLKRNLTKCQDSLNESIAIVELLNEMLPEMERLEPFAPWSDEPDEEADECFASS